MNKKIKEKWIAALRSGKYTQGRGYLNYGGDMCCLGVLCDTVEPTAWITGNGVGVVKANRSYIHTRYPSKELLARAEISEKEANLLAGLNDDGANFMFISIYIERNM